MESVTERQRYWKIRNKNITTVSSVIGVFLMEAGAYLR